PDGLAGDLSLEPPAHAHLAKRDFRLDTLQGRATLRQIAVHSSSFGNLEFTASTHDRILDLKLAGNLRESAIEGQGEWRLEGDYPGRGEIRFQPVRIATLKRLATKATGKEQDPPFEGVLEGKVE